MNAARQSVEAQKAQAAQLRAAGLLAHYMRTAFLAAGLKWDADNDTEIAEIVACIASGR